MKMVKSLLLGSAAGLLAMSGAQAADLPVKAKAVEYVRICSLYGAGFFYIPGTDTCIKLGGYLRADLTINGAIYDGPFWNGEGAIRDRYANFYNDRSRLALTIDTRTATEYGVVRTFGQADFQFSTFGATSSIGTAAAVFPSASVGQVNNDTAGNGYTAVEMVFIQFAGFTFGKSASAFSTPWHGYPGNNSSFLIGGFDTVTGINNVQYTWQFGNGVSATLGVDDSSANAFNRTQILNTVGGAAGGSIGATGAATAFVTGVGTAYGGTSAPDIVGNVRVDQAWGLFQISGALHDNHAGYFQNTNGPSTALGGASQVGAIANGHPDDKWGGAVSAALQIKNIPTGPGDDIKMDATWSLGASKYVLATSSPTPSAFDILNSNKLAMGVTTDSIYSGQSGINGTVFNGNNLTQQQLTRGWGFRGAFNHNWDPYWSTSLFGGIAGLSYNSTAKTLYCNAYSSTAGIAIGGTNNVTTGAAANPAGFLAGSTCDPGFTIGMVGLVTRWTPVKNLTFSAEVLYANLHTNMKGAANFPTPSTALPLPAGVYTFGDNGTTSLNLRVQRNF
ncbi:porin [Bradyrhizobium sp. NP1]|uniref:porin n=1 Tax=Bradyrhizobium sp. NP1 TaxID=3049772 RepID=UPI0025A56022|nr:porin [Bradyrhizobium sp. NP1]WJR81331.1 porin [Bradyrhizobium sp. NP1]